MNPSSCPFCSPKQNDIVLENSLWYAKWDDFPATKGHLLIIPFRHCSDYFATTQEEKSALIEMISECKMTIDQKYSPDGYNIVTNIGEAADQKVMHCHIHIIPRYSDKKENPPAGIKGIVFKNLIK